MTRTKRAISYKKFIFIYLTILLLILFLGISSGAVYFSPLKIFKLISDIFSKNEPDSLIFSLRLIRVFSALIVGGSLALAGSILQRLLRNPLADPFILGISTGGTLTATSAIVLGLPLFFWGFPIRIFYAFVGSFLTLLMILYLKKRFHQIQDEYAIPVIGLILNAFYGALLMLLVAITTPEKGRYVYSLMIGNLQSINISQFIVILIGVTILAGFLIRYSSAIHALSFGDDIAYSVGFNAGKIRKLVFILVAFIISLVVSISGSIGFIGLIVPHLARRIHGYSIRQEWIASIFIGSSLLILADTLGRTVAYPSELPAGLFTALIGAPVLGFILIRRASSK